MRGRQPVSYALDESTPEPPGARCGINPHLRMDRARSIRKLAPEVATGKLPSGEIGERQTKGGHEIEAASGEHDRMTGAISETGVSGQGRRRARQTVPRTRRVEVTLTGEEYKVIEAAARRAGLARRAYIAQAVLAAAVNGGPLGDRASLRWVLIELMRAAGLVRRIGTNIDQAVAKLNATGQPAGNLPGYAAETIRRADHIDEVADAVRKALR